MSLLQPLLLINAPTAVRQAQGWRMPVNASAYDNKPPSLIFTGLHSGVGGNETARLALP